MSEFNSTFRLFVKEGLKPKVVSSYAGSKLIVTDVSQNAFDPKGNMIDSWRHQQYKDLYELLWTFSFISDKTQDALRRCDKIVLVGPPANYYKVYFFTDDYRSFKIELKADKSAILKNHLPTKLRKGRGKAYYDELTALSLSHAVSQGRAGLLLTDCPYANQTVDFSLPHSMIFKWVKYMLCCDLIGQADQKINQSQLTNSNA